MLEEVKAGERAGRFALTASGPGAEAQGSLLPSSSTVLGAKEGDDSMTVGFHGKDGIHDNSAQDGHESGIG